MTLVPNLEARLAQLHERTAETPLFNPVFQLALELSRDMESGQLGLDAVEAAVAELECSSLQARAARLHRLVGPVDSAANARRLSEGVGTSVGTGPGVDATEAAPARAATASDLRFLSSG